ncbi:MAG TPA: hypothetical protein VFF76_02660 [Holophagaceae bacterium]|nr:hypothetical protein [Holophagaceae bacterium]
MITTYNRKSLMFGVPGLVLQYGGLFLAVDFFLVGVLGMFTGTILLFVGLGFYLKAKNRNLAWAVLIFIPILGILLLALLVDKSKTLSARHT